ncbi:hypothetical protein B0H66DRAFT_602460 [Apodospora peruviana]|uniref:Uncharacterized protein n=1 Tax=Apodospora peruviana TaxID=516989 RepID=A0AAE0IEZ1_9PEZI|nr:hypothetical protein B0H66DRAFT_602460 [Apodospora peruviana]
MANLKLWSDKARRWAAARIMPNDSNPSNNSNNSQSISNDDGDQHYKSPYTSHKSSHEEHFISSGPAALGPEQQYPQRTISAASAIPGYPPTEPPPPYEYLVSIPNAPRTQPSLIGFPVGTPNTARTQLPPIDLLVSGPNAPPPTRTSNDRNNVNRGREPIRQFCAPRFTEVEIQRRGGDGAVVYLHCAGCGQDHPDGYFSMKQPGLPLTSRL